MGKKSWEGSAADTAQDKKLAKKHGMSMANWEKSSMDTKHDMQKSSKGLRGGGIAVKGKGIALKKGGKVKKYADGGDVFASTQAMPSRLSSGTGIMRAGGSNNPSWFDRGPELAPPEFSRFNRRPGIQVTSSRTLGGGDMGSRLGGGDMGSRLGGGSALDRTPEGNKPNMPGYVGPAPVGNFNPRNPGGSALGRTPEGNPPNIQGYKKGGAVKKRGGGIATRGMGIALKGGGRAKGCM